MAYSKRDLILAAFDEIGLASYVFDLSPEQLNSALLKLDAMLAAWQIKGIRLGYPFAMQPSTSDLDEFANLPDYAIEAVYTNLAIKLAPSYGKQVLPETKIAAKTGYDNLLLIASAPVPYQLPATMPSGQGNKPWQITTPFIVPPTDPLTTGQDGLISFD